MTVELLKTISLISYILAGVLAVTAVALFFVLDVRSLFGEVSGSTAKKAIENIRKQNADGSGTIYKPSHVNHARGKVTDKMTVSGNLVPKTASNIPSVGTEKFLTEQLNLTYEQTTVLETQPANETTVLTEEAREFYLVVEMGFLGSTELIE